MGPPLSTFLNFGECGPPLSLWYMSEWVPLSTLVNSGECVRLCPYLYFGE